MAPAYAASRSAIDGRLLAALSLGFSLCAFLAYRSDKRRAEAGEWRVSESTLHILAILGGWPGAFIAQRVFGHKTAKASFQVVFWVIVALHQFVAIDSVLGWRLTQDVFHAVASSAGVTLTPVKT